MTTPATSIDVCVCTFRRPQLADTLRSLAAQRLPAGMRMQVIVADNDDTPSARALSRELAAGLGLRLRYIHCPARNISLARNACLEASNADLLAFIDDDETAPPGWLAALVAVAGMDAADVVLGPVRAIYGDDAPGWMREGDFHSTFPVLVRGEIRTGYTCNALLRRASPRFVGKRFDLARGTTGGEDTEFFDAVWRAGGRIAFAPEAWLEEPVPLSRASFGWLARRRLRVGQTHGSLLRARLGLAALPGQAVLALAKAGYSFAAALPVAASPVRRNRTVLRGLMHLGTFGGLAGLREARHYGTGGGEAAIFAPVGVPPPGGPAKEGGQT